MSEIVKQKQRNLDGFEAYTDEVDGEEDQSPSNRVIQGIRLKFTNEATWIDDADEELPAGLELIAIDVGRVVQKWVDQLPAETIVLGPGEKFPDIAKLNADCPKSEWREGLGGQMQGPWQAQHIVYLLDPNTMTRYSWPTSTVGGAICVRDLVDKVKWMRKYRGINVYAVVTLSDVFMNTRFGGRQRPHFEIKRWIKFGPDGDVTALPAPDKPGLSGTATRTVDPPSAKEVTRDEIPW